MNYGMQDGPKKRGKDPFVQVPQESNSIESIDSISFRSLAEVLQSRSRRDDRFRQKIVKIRAILAIFRPFEDFGDFRFDRFDIFFDSIDTEPNDRWGPPCKSDLLTSQQSSLQVVTCSNHCPGSRIQVRCFHASMFSFTDTFTMSNYWSFV